ncbi:MAG: YtxH domain-containing protein [Candidatus Gracilibacteria bacterium]
MFGFGKKKKQEKLQKKKSKIDKLIMGAIVGGAVGSVIGMSIAPQKGKETREMIAQKGKELIKKGQDSLEKLTDGAEKKTQPEEEMISEARKNKKGVFSRLKDKVLGPGKKVKKGIMEDDDMRKIPNEVE